MSYNGKLVGCFFKLQPVSRGGRNYPSSLLRPEGADGRAEGEQKIETACWNTSGASPSTEVNWFAIDLDEHINPWIQS